MIKHHHNHFSYDAHSQRDERYRQTVKVTVIGSLIDALLGVAKIIVGWMSHSQALVADGIHSLSDLATDFLVLYAAKHASREADDEHPYGHGRIETAMTVALGVTLIFIGLGIAFDAVVQLFEPETILKSGILALSVAALSSIVKEIIYHYTMHTAVKYRSEMLKANAWHSRTDAISSVIVVIGIIGTMAGFSYLDAIAAIVVGLLIVKIGWDLGWQSIRELVDTALDKEKIDEIRSIIESTDGVSAMHLLRSRLMGGDALVDVHVQVEPRLSVSEGHYIGESVRQRLIEEITEIADVTVHIDCEDDLTAAASNEMPPRHAIVARLNDYFSEISSAKQIQRITLHYLDGKIQVELIFPLKLLANSQNTSQLQQQFSQAVATDPDITEIKLTFT